MKEMIREIWNLWVCIGAGMALVAVVGLPLWIVLTLIYWLGH